MTRSAATPLTDVPVFPLPQVVLFPGARLPLHIFEPRYRAMLADCIEAGGAIVIARLDRSGGRMAEIAGAGTIIECEPLADGRSNIVVVGAARVRLDEVLLEELPRYPYKRAHATRLESLEVGVNSGDRSALLATAAMFAAEVNKHDPSFSFRLPSELDGGGVADTCAFQLVVDASVRQAILEQLDPRVRVRLVMDQLALQHSAMLSDSNGSVLN